ncbi:MAG: C40 family peptidase [Filifactoraceae bacterium]
MKKLISKNIITLGITVGIMLMGVIGVSADDEEFRLVKVMRDGYSIVEDKDSGKVIQNVYKNQNLFFHKREGDWVKVTTTENNIEGYIPFSAIDSDQKETSATSEKSKGDVTGEEVVRLAKTKIGSPYVYGASGPYSFDCSGYTSYVYRQFGVYLPRTSGEQARVGRAVSYSAAEPGDLVSYSGHVAIYIGDGKIIHSPQPGQSVKIGSISSVGRVKSIRRVI